MFSLITLVRAEYGVGASLAAEHRSYKRAAIVDVAIGIIFGVLYLFSAQLGILHLPIGTATPFSVIAITQVALPLLIYFCCGNKG